MAIELSSGAGEKRSEESTVQQSRGREAGWAAEGSLGGGGLASSVQNEGAREDEE